MLVDECARSLAERVKALSVCWAKARLGAGEQFKGATFITTYPTRHGLMRHSFGDASAPRTVSGLDLSPCKGRRRHRKPFPLGYCSIG
jgi:hypothetical protein